MLNFKSCDCHTSLFALGSRVDKFNVLSLLTTKMVSYSVACEELKIKSASPVKYSSSAYLP